MSMVMKYADNIVKVKPRLLLLSFDPKSDLLEDVLQSVDQNPVHISLFTMELQIFS